MEEGSTLTCKCRCILPLPKHDNYHYPLSNSRQRYRRNHNYCPNTRSSLHHNHILLFRPHGPPSRSRVWLHPRHQASIWVWYPGKQSRERLPGRPSRVLERPMPIINLRFRHNLSNGNPCPYLAIPRPHNNVRLVRRIRTKPIYSHLRRLTVLLLHLTSNKTNHSRNVVPRLSSLTCNRICRSQSSVFRPIPAPHHRLTTWATR